MADFSAENTMEIRISVRGLVEFILRQGDIDNRRKHTPEDAMQEGGRIHREIRKRMGAEYRAEVFLRHVVPGEKYLFVVEGRADGIIDTRKADGTGETVIDEIKGTYRELSRMKAPVPVHLAQAKCYAYMYGTRTKAEEVRIRMTYCNLLTEDLRYFYEDFTMEELTEWFEELIRAYRKWADYEWEWRQLRQASIEKLEFPFPYREGQKELAAQVYQTIYHKKKLFLEAPTGVGKTVSTVFPSVKAMGKGMGEKLFYLTAKTITRTVAEDTFGLLRQKGLRFKSVILTAKEKICFLEEMSCNPEHCPYAEGHYDRINEAVYDLLTQEESFTREKVEKYAKKHTVCPFEMSLDMSLFADGVICDYHYLFDPHVYLKRFFGEKSSGNYLFLIDEAHNLLERGREMYSADLVKEDFLEFKRKLRRRIEEEGGRTDLLRIGGQSADSPSADSPSADSPPADSPPADRRQVGRRKVGGQSVLVRKGYAAKLEKQLERCNQELLKMKRQCEDWRLAQDIASLVQPLARLQSTLEDYLDEQEEILYEVQEALLEFYFHICHFLEIHALIQEREQAETERASSYVIYTRLKEDGKFLLKLFCVNPSAHLRKCMERGRSAVLFSATLLPIQYYKNLLGGEKEDYEVYAQSVFRPDKKALFIANDVTSRYARRSPQEYFMISRYIHEIVQKRHGNYLVFCPSYSFLQAVFNVYQENFATAQVCGILQQDFMNERERESFLANFRRQDGHFLVGFCVLGGIFGEGIDLKHDRLIGVIIIGTGLPLVCPEREILKNYFDERGENGFDYSYRYPGMNKVLQAAGRVIRTAEDVGIIALLDERFLRYAYRRMFPREWEEFEEVTVDTVSKRVERFWDSWL
ncbi:MAG: ATP-dependent DNA helicase [Clostridium sp.]|jgi:Rad3-related DNA helicase|nr:ATP-dependent DNA helicase [Clostridium sp.]